MHSRSKVVLWSFREHDIQLGSPEDLAQAEEKRRLAQALRGLAKAMHEQQIYMHKLGVSARKASQNLIENHRRMYQRKGR